MSSLPYYEYRTAARPHMVGEKWVHYAHCVHNAFKEGKNVCTKAFAVLTAV